jgi:hypothetical protein
MFRYMCTLYRENKMPVFKNQLPWKAVTYKVLWSAAASLLMLIKLA